MVVTFDTNTKFRLVKNLLILLLESNQNFKFSLKFSNFCSFKGMQILWPSACFYF